MRKLLRFSAFNLGLMYVAVSLLALLLFATPLWYAWQASIERGRIDELRSEGLRWSALLERKGMPALVEAVAGFVDDGPDGGGNELILLADSRHRKLAGNLPGWPDGLGDGLENGRDVQALWLDNDVQSMRVVFFDQPLANGAHLLLGRNVDRFETLETYFWTGLLGAAAIMMCVGVGAGFVVRRSLLFRVRDINLAARAVMQGDLSHRLPAYVGEDELNALVDTQNRMLDQMQHLVEGVRNVSNSIAHDLRTPLTELRTRLEEVSVTRPEPEQVFADIDHAIGDVDRVIGIFNALLRMAEIDNGVRRAGFVTVDLRQLAEDAVEFYAPLAELKEVSLHFASYGDAVLTGDPVLLAQALGNLIDNAIKYGRCTGRVDVRIARSRNEFSLTVADDGPGIDDAEKAKVLERFYRGDASRGTPGAGLGLSLVHTIARLHGGTLTLSNNHPGLCARLTLPMTQ